MWRAVFLAHIVDVVGGDQLNAKFVGPGHQGFVDLDKFGDVMFLQFNEEVLFAKDIDIPAEALVGFLLLCPG